VTVSEGGLRSTPVKEFVERKKIICNLCNKTYFSNPALYTHKRNKHNLFPISGNADSYKKLFKSIEHRLDIKFCDYENLESFGDSIQYILNIYRGKLNYFYNDIKCILYRKNFNYEIHKGYLNLSQMTQCKIAEILNCSRKTAPSIDDILSTYMISFLRITKNEELIYIVITYCILLREYLNNFGWEHKKKFHDFGVKIEYNYKGAFCSFNDSEYIPDLINDFVSIFMNLDPLFSLGENDLLCITDNFCNWLFINSLTGFKLNPNTI
jgi:hypothetical protein